MSEQPDPPMADAAPQPFVPRPRVVFWAGILCLVCGVTALLVHTFLTWRLGTVDVGSYAQGVLLLVAGGLNFGMPRSRLAFDLGALALIAIVIRCVSYVPSAIGWGQAWHDRAVQATFGVAMTAGFMRLTWLFVKGKPSREYFKLPL